MKIQHSLIIAALCTCTGIHAADTLSVYNFKYSGPVAVQEPVAIDSLGTDGKPFDATSILDASISLDKVWSGKTIPSGEALYGEALHLLGFCLDNSSFSVARILVEGVEHYVLFADGEELCGQSPHEVNLEPGTHRFTIKCLTSSEKSEIPDISVVQVRGGELAIREDGMSRYSLDLNTQGESCSGISVSPGGKCLALTYGTVDKSGKYHSKTDIVRLSDKSILSRTTGTINWMPSGDSYYFTRPSISGKDLICADPVNGTESTLCSDIPEGDFEIVPGGRYLIYSLVKEGPKEGDVHQILTPDDRQPGWRDRTYLARYDMSTGLMQPMTFGYNNVFLCDISRDGSKLLFMTTRERLGERPTSLMSLYVMDINSLKADCIVRDDGFIGSASFSPKADKVLVTGSPEAFGGIGKTTAEGIIPNMYDYQLFTIGIDGSMPTALTRDFNPGVSRAVWNGLDGRIYALAEDKDCMKLFRISPNGGKIERLPDLEDDITRFDIADDAPVLVCSGQSLENGDRVYSMDIWKLRTSLLADISASRFKDVAFGQGNAYEFTNGRGETINGFYVLPPDFDPQKKYPMLVHYYGGCSPSTRYCVGSYSPQYYAAQGFIFYVINPSGASGFGQEFSSRHVNTAGDFVADDIIEGTKRFCMDHPYVDTYHIGCFSASYGGFMTQLLLTKTDIYATGISHAGISDHTSYWGEGYWGYSYSEVSMADSYPWTRKDLYVDRSPLFMADKIHTPLLFLHGSADTNVPIGESIQMFTALKLLGQDTAFVVVDGENHGIRDYAKRRQWLRTISAWFSKYLKEDPTWWDTLYPPKNL